MGKVLWLDCSSGISGDMTVAALLDAGADRAALDRALRSLEGVLEGFEVRVGRVKKCGLDACDFDVVLDAAHENHDHDMDWLHGDADKGGHRHVHEHRTLADVLHVLAHADVTPGARAVAERAFGVLAQGEAAAHGTTVDRVHFHEVGAVDSIVDVLAAAVCLDSLGVDEVAITELAEGCGTVRCAHGVLPVPVPAVTAIACAYGLPLRACGVRGELVTPTGAAIAAAVRTRGELPARFRIARVGIGAGKRSYEGCSGVVRALVLEELAEGPGARADEARAARSEPAQGGGRAEAQGCSDAGVETATRADRIVKLECDIDDCTGEALGRVVGLLMDAGAREAHYLPVFTKKGRPAWQLQVVCDEDTRGRLEALVFAETTTIGIRRCAMERTVLPRRAVGVQTALGPIAAKEVVLPDGRVRRYPEHASVEEAAARAGVSYVDAWQAAVAGCAQR